MSDLLQMYDGATQDSWYRMCAEPPKCLTKDMIAILKRIEPGIGLK